MPSKYEERIKAIALEEDLDKRLESAGEIDKDLENLDEMWEAREGFLQVEQERDALRDERDNLIKDNEALKKKYADRFFDPGEDITSREEIIDKHVMDVKQENQNVGFERLWERRDD